MKSLGGLECRPDVQGVVPMLFCKPLFTFGKCRTKEGVAVCGEYDFPWLEVEGYLADVASVDREAVDYAIGDVLLLHGFQHVWDNNAACQVVA